MQLAKLTPLSLWASLARAALSLPDRIQEMSLDPARTKRWEAGPQMNGANFPDPSIIQYNGVWYSFATRTIGSGVHIQIAQSQDFHTWTLVYNEDGSQRDALPNLPSWVNAASPNTWAPDVSRLDDGTFIMYYSASTIMQTNRHCTGAALSSNILGPYAPQESPLFCPLSQGGAIDAAGYNNNGQRYVVYKVDGNSIGHGGICSNTNPPIVRTPILLLAVAADGVTLQGNAVEILDNNGIPDGGSVEAPSLVKSHGVYVLFFSSGCYITPNYTVNYAVAKSITGPYQRAAHPLFATDDHGLVAPGGMSIYSDGKHMVFHANYGGGRALYNAVVAIKGGQAILKTSVANVLRARHGLALAMLSLFLALAGRLVKQNFLLG